MVTGHSGEPAICSGSCHQARRRRRECVGSGRACHVLPSLTLALFAVAQRRRRRLRFGRRGRGEVRTGTATGSKSRPNDLLVMDLAGGKRVVIQLAPQFAPVHVANVRTWRAAVTGPRRPSIASSTIGCTQWGLNGCERWRHVNADFPQVSSLVRLEEYERAAAGLKTVPMGSPDPYSMKGGLCGRLAGRAPAARQANPTYCYGAVGVARDAAPDTGNGSELFAVIGATARRLDRNYALIGRVLSGMENLSALPRGTGRDGRLCQGPGADPITAVRIATDIPAADRPRFEYLRTGSPAFADYVKLASHRADYGVPSPGADLCAVPVPVRKVEPKA